MSRSTYSIRYERHVSAPVLDSSGHRHPGIVFTYSICRPDGSLLFRARNHEEARDLVTRLYEVEDSAR